MVEFVLSLWIVTMTQNAISLAHTQRVLLLYYCHQIKQMVTDRIFWLAGFPGLSVSVTLERSDMKGKEEK